MQGWGEVLAALVVLLITIGLFLLFRKVVLWYWGISAMLAHLEELVQQNNQLLALLRSRQGQASAPPQVVPGDQT